MPGHVWLLLTGLRYEGTTVLGVYTRFDLAARACDAMAQTQADWRTATRVAVNTQGTRWQTALASLTIQAYPIITEVP